MNNCECNNIVCPSTVKKLFDCDNNIIDINSNFPMNFTLCDGITLPKDSKIEILETRVNYNLSNIEKELLINGKKIDCEKYSLYDCIYVKNNLINLPKDNTNKILLSIIEFLKLEVNCSIEIKAIAHTVSCEKIYIKAIGKSKDSIDTILMSKCCIPYNNCNFNETYLELNNCLTTIVNPDYIFLSPIYDCCSNIDNFLGKVFINYKINLELICYKEVKKCFYDTLPKYNKKSLKIN